MKLLILYSLFCPLLALLDSEPHRLARFVVVFVVVVVVVVVVIVVVVVVVVCHLSLSLLFRCGAVF